MLRLAIILLLCVFLTHISADGEHPKNHHHFKDNHFRNDLHPLKDRYRTRHHADLKHIPHSHKIKNRDNSGGNTTCNQNNGRLIFSFNSSTSFQGLYNLTGGVGAAANIKKSIVVIYNERTNIAIAINYNIGSGIAVHPNATDAGNLKNLTDREASNGTPFNLTNIPSNISQEVSTILRNLNYSSLANFITDTNSTNAFFRQYERFLSDFQSQIQGGFQQVVKQLQGLGGLFGGINNRTDLSRGNFSLDLGNILNQPLGINAFTSILQQLQRSFSLEQIFGGGLNSSQNFWSQIGRFDPVSNVISGLLNSTSGNSSPQDIVRALIEYFGNSANNSSLISQPWRQGLQNLLQIFRNSSSNSSIPGLEQIQRILNNQSWPINGTNISNILPNLLNSSSTDPIFNIVRILTSLSQNIPFQNSIPNLIGQLISLGQNGSFPLTNLIPNFNNSSLSSFSQGGFQNIAGTFLSLFQSGFQAFIQLFIVGPLRIFAAPIMSALSQNGQGNLSLPQLFQAGGFQFFIQGLSAFPSFIAGMMRNETIFFASMASSWAHVAASGAGNFINASSNAAQAAGNVGNDFAHAAQSAVSGAENLFQNGVESFVNGIPTPSNPSNRERFEHHGKKARLHEDLHHLKGKEKKHEHQREHQGHTALHR